MHRAGREPSLALSRRPNGVVLEIRTVPLPDEAGVVRTYTDVTATRDPTGLDLPRPDRAR